MLYVSFIWLTIILQSRIQLFSKHKNLGGGVGEEGKEGSGRQISSGRFGSVICIIPHKQMMKAMTNSYCDTVLIISRRQNGNKSLLLDLFFMFALFWIYL